ncbi:helix-turn-helix domain-containing protein [Paenibacillus shenyangensis]|uniref:helix-turn-helix domain-containing protein n=1 Tax=Paenibacillus sp. A9 TaxID=1284352 RepID=UPI000380DE24|nr:XRE family transcriptional regulator [Paenibacillus sp. A9]
MEPIQSVIAKNLARIRKSKNLTLDQTSELTGVSKAMLAQIENEKSNPTISTLWKIANGLQVSFTTFLKEEEVLVRRVNMNEVNMIMDSDDKYRVYPFFPYHPEKRFELYIVELLPGCVHEPKTHPGEEYLIVKQGSMIVDLKGEQYELTEGDALQFSGTHLHGYSNPTAEKASFFMMMHYPDDTLQ